MLEIEIVESNIIEGGIEVFARAWNENGQIGFGKDGTVDIERFRIFNPPILVEDPEGDIVRVPEQKEGEFTVISTWRLREDPEEALLQSLEHTINMLKNKSDSSNIVVGKRGNTTSTFYPADGANSPVDGYATRSVTGETWAQTRDAAVAGASVGAPTGTTQTTLQVAQGEDCGVCGRYIIYRNAVTFNTAAIPDSDVISSATFSLYGNGGGDTTNGDGAAIVSVTLASSSNIVAADYAKANWGTTDFATRQSLTTLNSVGWKDFALNASGIANIDKTGVSYFGVRSTNDVDNSEPTQRGYTFVRSADQAGTSTDPKLVVEHSAAATNAVKSINGISNV